MEDSKAAKRVRNKVANLDKWLETGLRRFKDMDLSIEDRNAICGTLQRHINEFRPPSVEEQLEQIRQEAP